MGTVYASNFAMVVAKVMHLPGDEAPGPNASGVPKLCYVFFPHRTITVLLTTGRNPQRIWRREPLGGQLRTVRLELIACMCVGRLRARYQYRKAQ